MPVSSDPDKVQKQTEGLRNKCVELQAPWLYVAASTSDDLREEYIRRFGDPSKGAFKERIAAFTKAWNAA